MEIDKNPRQITRLRVEDQVKLEKLASVTRFYEGDNTPYFDALNVNGELYINTGMIISNNSQNKGNSIDLLNTDGTIYLNGTDTDNNYIEFNLDGTIQTALTNKNTKTIFGKSIMKDPEQPENNNINLYRHQLTLNSATNTYIGVIYLLDNTPITSTQLLTTYTKAFNGYIFLAVKVTGPMGAQYAVGIGYTNNKWATTDSDAITNVSDVVKPL